MTEVDALNILIKNVDSNKVSDGYHTFEELYEHRIVLYIALCQAIQTINIVRENKQIVWRSILHSDGSSLDHWFVLGIAKARDHQITYHLPNTYWKDCDFAETLDIAPEFDGHNSQDVINRLKQYFIK